MQIEQAARLRQIAALGNRRIERIAGSRGQHDIGRLLTLGPVLADFHALQQADMIEFAAAETMHRSGKLREALHIAALFEEGAIHAGRKAHGLRTVAAANLVDETLEGSDHLLELAAAAIEPIDARIDQQAGFEKPVEKRGLHIHDCHPSRLVSCLWTRSMLDVLPRMRSFEIMS
ncbi:cell division protein ZapA (FtsZ GTPase activity inhibitor) [Rhizobium redzepovicii]